MLDGRVDEARSCSVVRGFVCNFIKTCDRYAGRLKDVPATRPKTYLVGFVLQACCPGGPLVSDGSIRQSDA